MERPWTVVIFDVNAGTTSVTNVLAAYDNLLAKREIESSLWSNAQVLALIPGYHADSSHSYGDVSRAHNTPPGRQPNCS